ncbi:MAG: hypothetical protein LBO20_05440 [Bifidobacteriaceae bacterium]|jgi:uroporphyrinogen decarboxylase|nr:hypothetical protein [Bifidobacteriaceae bacterium]
MTTWTKVDRFRANLAGEPADRPAVSAYAHIVEAERNADDLVKASLDYGLTWDWDWIKLNPRTVHYAEAWGNTYDYDRYGKFIPIPEQLTAVLTAPTELGRITRLAARDVPQFQEQLEVVRRVKAGAQGAAVVATLYSPFNVFLKLGGLPLAPNFLPPGSTTPLTFEDFVKADRAGVHRALRAIADTLAEYAALQREAGADGLVYVVANTTSTLGEAYREFAQPYDNIVLDGAAGIPRIVHTCGADAHPQWFEEFPLEGVNWDTFEPSNPGPEVLTKTVFVGGVNAGLLGGLQPDVPLAQTIAEQAAASRAVTDNRLVLAPSCSISAAAPAEALKAFRAAAE